MYATKLSYGNNGSVGSESNEGNNEGSEGNNEGSEGNDDDSDVFVSRLYSPVSFPAYCCMIGEPCSWSYYYVCELKRSCFTYSDSSQKL